MWPELKRKAFHLTALIYCAGFLFLPRSQYISLLSCWLILEFAVEILRIKNSSVRAWFSTHFKGITREKEEFHFTGIFWMITGVLSTAVLLEPTKLAVTALLYLIFGDAAASLIGKSIKGPHWFRSDKRISGSVGCFLVCVLIGVLVLGPDYSKGTIFGGALVATFLEMGLIPGNDNLLIPAGSAVFFLIYQNLKPFFWS